MGNTRRFPSPWKLALLGGGALSWLALLVTLPHRSGPGCGALLLGRYSAVYFAGLVGLFIAGAAAILAGALLDPRQIRAWLGRLAALGIGVALALLLMEAYLRLSNPVRSIDDLRYDNHEVLGYFRKPDWTFDVRAVHGYEYRNRMSTDDLGLIIRGDGPNRPDSDARRILLLGDSMVEGVEVPAQANLSEIMAGELTASTGDPYQVINLGHASYDPITYYLSYQVFAETFDPEIVVAVLYVGNDFTFAARYFHAGRVRVDEEGRPLAMLPRFDFEQRTEWDIDSLTESPLPVRENGMRRGIQVIDFIRQQTTTRICQARERVAPTQPDSVTAQQEDCADLSGDLTVVCNHYLLRDDSLVRNNRLAIYKESYTAFDQEDMSLALEPLALLAEQVRANGRTFYLVIMPQKAQVPDQPGTPYVVGLEEGDVIDSTRPQEVVLDFCAEQGIACFDLLPTLREHSDQTLFWLYDQHLTEAGHRVAGEALAEWLLEEEGE